MIEQESRFDGFYGICTDLWDDAPEIIKVNGGRWIIEDCFRLTKTEFEARPVFLQRDDRITAHFLTCFLALIIYKYLAKKVNRAGEKFSPDQIIGTLQDMNFLKVTGEGYIPTYTRTDLTNHLHGSAGFRTDTQIVTKKAMKSIIASIKTSRIKRTMTRCSPTGSQPRRTWPAHGLGKWEVPAGYKFPRWRGHRRR